MGQLLLNMASAIVTDSTFSYACREGERSVGFHAFKNSFCF